MPYTGITGKLTIDYGEKSDQKVAYISNWSVDETRDVIEITQLGKKIKEIKPSLYYWSASAEGAADFSDGAQDAIRDAMLKGEPVNVKFYLSDEKEKETYLEGEGYVTAFSVNISAEDKGGVSISLTGNDQLKLTKLGVQTPDPEDTEDTEEQV